MVAGAYAGFTASHFDGGLAVHAVSGIETALWDLAGKARGPARLPSFSAAAIATASGCMPVWASSTPIWRWRMSTRNWASPVSSSTSPQSAIADLAGGTMDQHLTRKGLREIVALLEKIRARVGDDIEIAVEARCGTVANALRFVKAVEPFDSNLGRRSHPADRYRRLGEPHQRNAGAHPDRRGFASPARVSRLLSPRGDEYRGAGLPGLRRFGRRQENLRDGGSASHAGSSSQRPPAPSALPPPCTPVRRSRTCWRSSSMPCPNGSAS